MQKSFKLLIAVAASITSGSAVQAQGARLDEQSAKIVDQLERLVQRPNVIAITKAQRKSMDSLETAYLQMARAIEAESRAADNKMQVSMKFREQQLAFHDHVRKLMTPSQLDDFEKNAYAAATAPKGTP